MKRKVFAGLLFLGLIMGQRTVAQVNLSKLDLKQCIELALNNNLPVKQAALDAEAAEVNFKQTKANLLPNLNGSFGYGLNQGRTVDPITNGYINQHLTSSSVSLNSSVVLFNGLRLQNLIRQSKYSYEASKMDWQQVKDNLTLNVILAYLQVLSNEDMLDIAKGQLEVVIKQVERMEVLAREGAVGNYQFTDLKGQQSGNEISIQTQENNLQQSKLNLCQLMNIEYNPDLQLDRAPTDAESILSQYPSGPAEVFQSALENLALVKANELKLKSADKAISVARGNYFPSLSLNANMGSNYSSLAQRFFATNTTEIPTGDYVVISGNENPVLRRQQNYTSEKIGYTNQLGNNLGTFAGISLRVPLFNNFFVRNQVKLATISKKNQELISASTNQDLKRDIEQTWLNMNAAYNRYKILLDQVANFEESFRAAEIRFNSGVINAYEYLIAKNNLDLSRINLAQVKYEYIFRTRMLDFYSGKQLW